MSQKSVVSSQPRPLALLLAALLTPSLLGQDALLLLPNNDDIQQANSVIDEAYGHLFDTRESVKLGKAAAKLLEGALQETEGTALHYQALYRVAGLAAESQRVDLGMTALSVLEHYNLDILPLRLSFCRQLAENDSLGSEAARGALEVLSQFLIDAAATDEETIGELLQLSGRFASELSKSPQAAAIVELAARIDDSNEQALDREALFAVAVCLAPDRWDAAVGVLPETRNPRLDKPLRLEAQRGTSSPGENELADAWHDAYRAYESDPTAWAWGWRALHWYTAAIESDSLKQILADRAGKRIRDLKSALGMPAPAQDQFAPQADLAKPPQSRPARESADGSGAEHEVLPAIPPHVEINLRALEDHRRPWIYDKRFPQLRRALAAIKGAARGSDRQKFRDAIDEAIRVTREEQFRGHDGPGHVNCRSDVLLVLHRLRAGEWDLSRLQVWVPDHRKNRREEGLPGVRYPEPGSRRR